MSTATGWTACGRTTSSAGARRAPGSAGLLENLTHSLLGAAIAGAALEESAPASERRRLFLAGIVSANAPDLDLLYTWITPAPIGYLLHHRGHTHTVVGVIALSAFLTLIWTATPSVGRARPAIGRLAMVILAGVASHLLIDAANSYGVHPFYPVDMRWYYGDTFFIFEPLLWMLLGGTVAANARSRLTSVGVVALVGGLSLATGAIGIVPWSALIGLAASLSAAAWIGRRLTARVRAAAALAGVAVFGSVMFSASKLARAEIVAALPREAGVEMLDVVLTPSPGLPHCWSTIVIDKNESAGTLRFRQGSVSLLPRWRSAGACPLHALIADAPSDSAPVAIVHELAVPLDRLRGLAAADCRVSAWLRFTRAPVVAGERAYDLRFERPGGGNFTGMSLGRPAGEAACPPLVPPWSRPRADALDR